MTKQVCYEVKCSPRCGFKRVTLRSLCGLVSVVFTDECGDFKNFLVLNGQEFVIQFNKFLSTCRKTGIPMQVQSTKLPLVSCVGCASSPQTDFIAKRKAGAYLDSESPASDGLLSYLCDFTNGLYESWNVIVRKPSDVGVADFVLYGSKSIYQVHCEEKADKSVCCEFYVDAENVMTDNVHNLREYKVLFDGFRDKDMGYPKFDYEHPNFLLDAAKLELSTCNFSDMFLYPLTKRLHICFKFSGIGSVHLGKPDRYVVVMMKMGDGVTQKEFVCFSMAQFKKEMDEFYGGFPFSAWGFFGGVWDDSMAEGVKGVDFCKPNVKRCAGPRRAGPCKADSAVLASPVELMTPRPAPGSPQEATSAPLLFP